MGDWKPDRTVRADGVGIFLWLVPARWRAWGGSQGAALPVQLRQKWQQVGQAWIDGQPAPTAVLWATGWSWCCGRKAQTSRSRVMRCGQPLAGFSDGHKDAIAHRRWHTKARAPGASVSECPLLIGDRQRRH